MALADQTVTISGTAISLPRTGSGMREAEFTSPDGLTKETVRHTTGNRQTRHYIRLDNSKIAADPLAAGINVKSSIGVWIVINVPDVGYTVAEQKAVVDGFLAQLSASSGALVGKLLGNES